MGERSSRMNARRGITVALRSECDWRAHLAKRPFQLVHIPRIARLEQRSDEVGGSAPRCGLVRRRQPTLFRCGAPAPPTVLQRGARARGDTRQLRHRTRPHRTHNVGEEREAARAQLADACLLT